MLIAGPRHLRAVLDKHKVDATIDQITSELQEALKR
jgi:hypothetical protein